MFRLAPLFDSAARIALAVEETLTTPTPCLGYGRAADVASLITFSIGAL